MVGSLKDCAAPAVRRISCSDEGNLSGGPQNICKLCPDGYTAISISSPLIVHKDTAMRDAIPPAERLAVTLRFLATSILHNLLH